ncbi:tetratricopeptide repeat protein [Helicobacter baculiformis]|uniref:Beta-lactamase n=1 Tax=Helicobacter baculiformis TaxID=427351 RepID=A0ABV7ZJS6_9HELI|nr:SEL1-like repeat protein [Helicobacter baculiformis]
MAKVSACKAVLGALLGVCVLYANSEVDVYLSIAKEAYRHKDYAKALENYQKAAQLGSVDAYRSLANMYLIGVGVPKDSRKASVYSQRAMDIQHAQHKNLQSNTGAQPTQAQQPKAIGVKSTPEVVPTEAKTYMRLGESYTKGQGVALDFNKAIKAFEKAGEMGDARGFNALGDLYYNESQGVEQNYPKALEYYQKAAKMGQARDFRLGMMYLQGQGVAQSYPTALEYFQKAGKKGDGRAWQKLGALYFKGQGVPLDYQQAHAYYQEAIKSYLEAGKKGDGRAFVRLAQMYEEGEGVSKDATKALEYYQRAADLKSGDGAFYLATLILRGKLKGVIEDRAKITARYQQAIAFYQEEGKNGDANAYVKLGSIYKNGLYYYGWLLHKNAALSLEYYQKGAQMGNAQSYYEIGEAYRNARGVERDLQKQSQHYHQACLLGFKPACYALNHAN